MVQNLKQANPDVWKAFISLKSNPPPAPFFLKIDLPYNVSVGTDVVQNPIVIRIPTDPYGVWDFSSVVIQDIETICKIQPSTKDYLADLLITRNKRDKFVSVFGSSSVKLAIKLKSGYSVVTTNITTTEWLDNDELRVDVTQTDGIIRGVSIIARGYYDLKMIKKTG